MNIDSVVQLVIDWIADKGITGIVFIFFFSVIKAAATSMYNIFASKKIAEDIQRSRKVKDIIQRAEKSRFLMGADRVLVTQLHNGDVSLTGGHIYKLSLMQELSIDDPDGFYRTKIFDKQIKNLPISHLDPILTLVSTNRDFDIISVKELASMNFMYYRHMKVDKIKYIIITKIQHKGILLGYLFFLFVGDNIPVYDKPKITKLVELGHQVGDILA